jgi:hypothetical protein
VGDIANLALIRTKGILNARPVGFSRLTGEDWAKLMAGDVLCGVDVL